MRRMAFGDAERVDYEAEAAKQAEIAAKVEASQEPVASEASVAGETADVEDAAAAVDTDDIVTVRLVEGAEVEGEPVSHCRIAGVVVEPEGTEVTRAVALLLAENDNVEIVEDAD